MTTTTRRSLRTGLTIATIALAACSGPGGDAPDATAADAVPDAATCAGACEPIELAAADVSSFTGDGSHVYYTTWRQTDGIAVTPVGQADETTLYSGALARLPHGIALAADTLYWSTDDVELCAGLLVSMPAAGGSPPSTVASLLTRTGSIVIDGGVAWVALLGCNQIRGRVQKVTLATGAVEDVAIDQFAAHLTADATSLFWLNLVNGGNDQILRADKSGGAPVEIHAGASLQGLGVDGQDAYYGDISARAIMKVSRDGGTPTLVASTAPLTPAGVAVDATHVYWTAKPDAWPPEPGTVSRVAKTGGAVELLASDQDFGPSGWGDIALDPVAAYWAGGPLVMIAK